MEENDVVNRCLQTVMAMIVRKAEDCQLARTMNEGYAGGVISDDASVLIFNEKLYNEIVCKWALTVDIQKGVSNPDSYVLTATYLGVRIMFVKYIPKEEK